ncbi:hypothetical protein CKO28_20510 [Rhodovibrio sodomensis]|uniref:Uncharacterized protein n=1 Tax=Rhodovibrio sodomensis TaxID=1088 RepID=A0ABS1DIU3_9PROT|nr:hypothetical protein [Rhodovibrio sodomensis]MBK1670410.1 hypothetical protein [Rhodovibrio sodomensis]
MQLKKFNAESDCILLQVQDENLEFEDLEVRSGGRFFASRVSATQIEADGMVHVVSRQDGKRLFKANYPDTRAAAIFIESGQTGELDLEHVQLVRDPREKTLSIKPLSDSVQRTTRLDPVKALFLSSALRIAANHHRLIPERVR